ncbi:MAG: hypothetical protein EZS28_031064 [Streblomastix strix]|uniref:Uncharacterized protein n=1 Tax=Streblomastix strix TaxID=222440 RepID=A0A5J4USM2_9EUKA|nr:MAG: hypothetical protein EZS28_031064 [Streblomastix strix]
MHQHESQQRQSKERLLHKLPQHVYFNVFALSEEDALQELQFIYSLASLPQIMDPINYSINKSESIQKKKEHQQQNEITNSIEQQKDDSEEEIIVTPIDRVLLIRMLALFPYATHFYLDNGLFDVIDECISRSPAFQPYLFDAIFWTETPLNLDQKAQQRWGIEGEQFIIRFALENQDALIHGSSLVRYSGLLFESVLSWLLKLPLPISILQKDNDEQKIKSGNMMIDDVSDSQQTSVEWVFTRFTKNEKALLSTRVLKSMVTAVSLYQRAITSVAQASSSFSSSHQTIFTPILSINSNSGMTASNRSHSASSKKSKNKDNQKQIDQISKINESINQINNLDPLNLTISNDPTQKLVYLQPSLVTTIDLADRERISVILEECHSHTLFLVANLICLKAINPDKANVSMGMNSMNNIISSSLRSGKEKEKEKENMNVKQDEIFADQLYLTQIRQRKQISVSDCFSYYFSQPFEWVAILSSNINMCYHSLPLLVSLTEISLFCMNRKGEPTYTLLSNLAVLCRTSLLDVSQGIDGIQNSLFNNGMERSNSNERVKTNKDRVDKSQGKNRDKLGNDNESVVLDRFIVFIRCLIVYAAANASNILTHEPLKRMNKLRRQTNSSLKKVKHQKVQTVNAETMKWTLQILKDPHSHYTSTRNFLHDLATRLFKEISHMI